MGKIGGLGSWGLMLVLALCAATGCTRSRAPRGSVLHIPLKDNVKTSDPTNSYDLVSMEVGGQIYEGLYQYDYFTPPGQAPRVVPALAEGLPAFSKDGKTVTIRLKKGVRFQDDPCFVATGG